MTLINLVDTRHFEDNRWQLIEIKWNTIRNNNKHMFFSYTNPDSTIPRGNHYHKYKNERFYVLQWIVKLKVDDMKWVQEEHIFNEHLKKFIHIWPNLAHTFWNIWKDQLILIAIVDRKFIKKKPDTYPYVISS